MKLIVSDTKQNMQHILKIVYPLENKATVCCGLPTVEVNYYGAVLSMKTYSEWNVNKSGNSSIHLRALQFISSLPGVKIKKIYPFHLFLTLATATSNAIPLRTGHNNN
jgi:hypothetical protein